VDGVILDLWGEVPNLVEHLAGERLVPTEVALDVHTLRTFLFCLPDWFADFHAVFLHGVVARDDASSLVAQDTAGQTVQPGAADGFGRGVKAIGIAEPDEGISVHTITGNMRRHERIGR